MRLYSRNKKGKPIVWWAETDYQLNTNGHIELNIYYGQVDGKIQRKQRLTKSGKNLGKSNATTIEEQAKLDLSYLYKAQRDKDYFDSLKNGGVTLFADLRRENILKSFDLLERENSIVIERNEDLLDEVVEKERFIIEESTL